MNVKLWMEYNPRIFTAIKPSNKHQITSLYFHITYCLQNDMFKIILSTNLCPIFFFEIYVSDITFMSIIVMVNVKAKSGSIL